MVINRCDNAGMKLSTQIHRQGSHQSTYDKREKLYKSFFLTFF